MIYLQGRWTLQTVQATLLVCLLFKSILTHQDQDFEGQIFRKFKLAYKMRLGKVCFKIQTPGNILAEF